VSPVPIYLLLGGAAALGVHLGYNRLTRRRSRPEVVGLHLLFGAASLEPLLITLHGGVAGSGVKAPVFGLLAAGFIAAALVTGLLGVVAGRTSRRASNLTLCVHAVLALSALAMTAAWGLGL